YAGSGRLPVVTVEGDQQTDLEEQRSGIDQLCDAFPRGQLAFVVLFLDLLRAAAGLDLIFQLLKAGDQPAHAVGRGVSHHSMVISCRGFTIWDVSWGARPR